MATKVLDTEKFSQHTITYCFVQSVEAFTKKGNEHTHSTNFQQTLTFKIAHNTSLTQPQLENNHARIKNTVREQLGNYELAN